MSANPYGRPHAVWRGDNFVHMVTKPNDEPGLPVKKAVGFPAGSTTKQATYTGHLAEDGVKRAGEGEMWFPPFEAPTVITGTFVNNALAGKANVSYPKVRAHPRAGGARRSRLCARARRLPLMVVAVAPLRDGTCGTRRVLSQARL